MIDKKAATGRRENEVADKRAAVWIGPESFGLTRVTKTWVRRLGDADGGAGNA